MNYNKIAANLDEAVLNATPIAQISTEQSINLDEAYAIQSILIGRRYKRGEKSTGLKLGFTSKAKMEQMGVHDMIWGRLTDEMFYTNGGSIPKDKFIHPRAEPEIAFRISKPIDKALSIAEIMNYVDGVAVAIEIIDSRYKNFKFSLEDVIADNCSSTGYSIGEWKSTDHTVADIEMKLNVDGQVAPDRKLKCYIRQPHRIYGRHCPIVIGTR